jgi:hypothetical protein
MRALMSVLLTAGVALLALAPGLIADEKKKAEKDKLPETIYKAWMHSREEDKGGVKVYRPKGYKFPPARGRTGFEIKKDGELVLLDIAAADGTEKVKGKWKLEGKNKVSVTFPGTDRKAMKFEVVSCDGKVVKIK